MLSHLAGPPTGQPDDGPTLVVGPSLGTAVRRLWEPVLPHLPPTLRVVGWDLPGHGNAAPADHCSFPDVAADLLAALPPRFAYAGVSAGGAVGLHLALAAPSRIDRLTAICTGAVIGTPTGWQERATLVEQHGTGAVVDGSSQRWFAPGFTGGSALLDDLRSIDARSYAAVCRGLAEHDVRERLRSITTPVLAVAGSEDVATPPDALRFLASAVPNGRVTVVPGVAHLPTVEAPQALASLVWPGTRGQ